MTIRKVLDPELENRYGYYSLKGDQVVRYAAIYEGCKQLAYLIKELTPVFQDQLRALTCLYDVMFNANAVIARNEK